MLYDKNYNRHYFECTTVITAAMHVPNDVDFHTFTVPKFFRDLPTDFIFVHEIKFRHIHIQFLSYRDLLPIIEDSDFKLGAAHDMALNAAKAYPDPGFGYCTLYIDIYDLYSGDTVEISLYDVPHKDFLIQNAVCAKVSQWMNDNEKHLSEFRYSYRTVEQPGPTIQP